MVKKNDREANDRKRPQHFRFQWGKRTLRRPGKRDSTRQEKLRCPKILFFLPAISCMCQTYNLFHVITKCIY